MVRRPDHPYWYNWVGWQLYHRHRRTKAAKRRAAWDFINHIRKAPPGAIAIDCGANVGNITAALARNGFEVYAFEPDPLAFGVLERRFGHRTDVHLRQAAVGTEVSRQKLYRSVAWSDDPLHETTRSSLVPWDSIDRAAAVDVEVVDLFAFMRDVGRPIYLLKMDIEGSEVGILERLLDEHTYRDIPAIFVETHERFTAELAERTARIRERVAEAGIGNINLDWF